MRWTLALMDSDLQVKTLPGQSKTALGLLVGGNPHECPLLQLSTRKKYLSEAPNGMRKLFELKCIQVWFIDG